MSGVQFPLRADPYHLLAILGIIIYSNCNYHLINLELLTKEDIIEINKKVGEKGIVINDGNLEFAVHKLSRNAPLEKKASALLHDLVSGHIFLDGNKRTAFVSTATLLKINGKNLEIKDEGVIDLVYGVANGKYNISEVESIMKKCIK